MGVLRLSAIGESSSEVEADLGILNYRRRRPVVTGSFGLRIRRLQRCQPIGFGYLNWMLFLTFFVLQRLLYCYFLTTTCVGCYEGIELRVYSEKLTPGIVEAIRDGQRYDTSEVYFDPNVHEITFWQLSADGTIRVDEGFDTPERVMERLCASAADHGIRGGVVLIQPHPDSTHQHIVTALAIARRDTRERTETRWPQRVACAQALLVGMTE